MTEEQKRWSKGLDPFESIRDNDLGLEVYFNSMVDILNNYESRVKELEEKIVQMEEEAEIIRINGDY